MKIDVKQAVRTATAFVRDIYAEQVQPVNNLRLEEVELSDDGRLWLVTLGFDRPIEQATGAYADISAALAFPQTVRDYKIIKVDADTGNVQSMIIRETNASLCG